MEDLTHDMTPRSDVTLHTANGRPLDATSVSPADLSSLPTDTLLRVLEVKRTLDSSLDQPKFSNLAASSRRKLDLDPVPYSPVVARMMSHVRGSPYSGSPSWSADLEAIDWTLKGDLLQLKNSYSATFEYQQQEIETLMNELRLCEYELKSKTAELDRVTETSLRDTSAFKDEIKSLQKTVDALKNENSARNSEISSLRQKLSLSEGQNVSLSTQVTALKAELSDTVQRASARETMLQTRLNDLIANNAEETEKLKLKHSDSLTNELAEQKSSLRQNHETEVQTLQRSHEQSRQNYEQIIKDLRIKMAKDAAENKAIVDKLKFDHERTLESATSREKEKAQSDEKELLRSLNFKHEQQLDELRRKISSLQNELEEKKRKSEENEESLRSRVHQLTNEIAELKKQFRDELECTKTSMKTESSDSLKRMEESLVEKHTKEKTKLLDEKKLLEDNLVQSETKLAEIHAKFGDLERQLHKLERKVVNSIEKTSGQLVKAVGLTWPPSSVHKADNVSSALEQLRWTVKETINAYSKNQTLVLDICQKWKTFEREKNLEMKKMKKQFDTETEDLLAFSKKEINDSYRHNMSQFHS